MEKGEVLNELLYNERLTASFCLASVGSRIMHRWPKIRYITVSNSTAKC